MTRHPPGSSTGSRPAARSAARPSTEQLAGSIASAPSPGCAPTQPLLKAAELDQLVAPIALHPDPLLSEILIASTYPLEVVQADRWAKSNKTLKGDALTAALAKQSWDDSVKSLVQVPTVLDDDERAARLDAEARRRRAGPAGRRHGRDPAAADHARGDNGKLKSTKEQTVTVKTEDQKQYDRDRAGLADRDLRSVLRARRGLRRLALSRLCAVLFSAARTATSPAARSPTGVAFAAARRRSPCLLGQLRLGPRQHQRRVQPIRQHQQHQSRQVGAQRRITVTA